ncbi:dipeptide ABC transporter ATP-binding protein [Georgenia sp. AZ-5]|uniref:dipeptide ABC transporter ATP-binding protein n=1 Tax=Georgenia sp. AZ-5 TaxID=3367526 RepID=UPI003753F190
MSAPVLEVAGLDVRLPAEDGEVHAVRGVDLAVHAGEVLAVVGESGAGKTTAALALLGLLPERARVRGSVRLAGEELVGRDDAALSAVRGARLAMVFQDALSALTPVHTVGDQIVEALRAHRPVPRATARRRAVELLATVGIDRPEDRARAYPHELSGGMRQRVVIAMAMANDPDVIVADEPTSALDVTVQAQVVDALRAARDATGAALVLVTHDLGVVASMADRVAVMYAGRVVEVGPVAEILARPRMPYTLGLVGALPRPGAAVLTPVEGAPPSPLDQVPGCPFAPRCPLATDTCREAEPSLAPVPDEPGGSGRRAACHRLTETAGAAPEDLFPAPAPTAPARRGPREEREEVLRVTGLVRHYPVRGPRRRRAGAVTAVDGISFDVRAGEALALVGESGSGKTTTTREILELRAPQAGTITVLGSDVARLTRASRRELRREVQLVHQDPDAALDPRMTVHDLVAEPLRADRRTWPGTRRRVAELLDLVGLGPELAARFPRHLSGGQRQRVAVARALALSPRLLVLDEPVSALDVSVRAGIVNLLADLRARLDLSYLLVSHDLPVVRHLADRVAVLHRGRIVEAGPVRRVFDRPAHPYTRALLSAVPVPDPAQRHRPRIVLPDDDAALAAKAGCRFRARCPLFRRLDDAAQQACRAADPPLRAVGERQEAACHHTER